MDATPWAACRRLLDDYVVAIDTTVAWGEMDALGHVNNIVYFRYFESARMAYFERIAYWQHLEKTGLGPILAETRCRFRTALTYPDHISVGARVVSIEEDRFRMEYAVASAAAGRIAAEGDGLIVSYDYRAGARAPLPAPVRSAIEALQQPA